MALPFPVTINDRNTTPEPPDKAGPFYFDGKVYCIQTNNPVDDFAVIKAFVSEDGGATWTVFDDAGTPGGLNTVACQDRNDPSKVYALVNGSVQVLVLGTGWGAIGSSFVQIPVTTCAWRPGGVVFFGQTNTNTSPDHLVPVAESYDIETDTFGDVLNLGFQDYDGEIVQWNSAVSGFALQEDGSIIVWTQQTTSSIDTATQTQFFIAPVTDYTIPYYVRAIKNIFMAGGGGGGGNGTVFGGGGGGGGAVNQNAGPIDVTPNDTVPMTAGGGGVGGSAGEDASFLGTTAGGGGAGAVDGTPGGGGGNGGAGGAGNVNGGGGGGGGGGTGGSGTNGQDASNIGGSGGTNWNGGGSGTGGVGGDTRDPSLNPGGAGINGGPVGQPDVAVANAGGGGGGGGINGAPGGTGGAGFIQFQFNPIVDLEPGRMFKQVVGADDSLGTLNQLDDTSLGIDQTTVGFDADANNGNSAYVICGVRETGNQTARVGIKLSGQMDYTERNVVVGNGANGQNPSIAIAVKSDGTVYLAYIKSDNSFVYRQSVNGGVFGDEVLVSDSGITAGCFISLASLNATTLQLAGIFGTPTQATAQVNGEGQPDLLFTSLVAGLQGNQIKVVILNEVGAPLFALTSLVVDDVRVITITFTVGTTVEGLLNGGTWADVATAFNASGAGQYVSMTGDSNIAAFAGSLTFTNGTTGQGGLA